MKQCFGTDKHIKNSEGAAVTVHHSNFFSVNSLGFEGGYKQSRHTVSVAPLPPGMGNGEGLLVLIGQKF